MGEPDERRRSERVDVNFEFRGEHVGSADTPTHVANLSENGVFVFTEHRLPLGTEVMLRFSVVIEDPVIIQGRGRVVRHQESPAGMGFEFTELDAEMMLRVADIVRRNRPRESGPPVVAAPTPPVTTVVRAKRADEVLAAERGRSEDDEAAQTLVKLRAVDVEIIDEDDLPSDDGQSI